MKESYGLLVHRDNNGVREYLIVHPSGNYNKNAPYMIPKGEQKGGEMPETAAVRETYEETGISAIITEMLGWVEYKSKSKRVQVWLAEYHCGEIEEDGNCPNRDWENDVAKFVTAEEAIELLKDEYKEIISTAEIILNLDKPAKFEEIKNEIRKIYGDVEIIITEGEYGKETIFEILTDLSVEEAIQKMDKFDEDYWLNQHYAIIKNIIVTHRFK